MDVEGATVLTVEVDVPAVDGAAVVVEVREVEVEKELVPVLKISIKNNNSIYTM